MSKETKSKKLEPTNGAEVMPAIQNKLSDTDKMFLDLAKAKRETALAEAKTALAQHEKAELTYKYIVLQIYMKYGLTEKDALNENGDILIGGAVQPAQAQ